MTYLIGASLVLLVLAGAVLLLRLFRNGIARPLEPVEALERRNEELSAALEQVLEVQADLIQAEKLSAMGRMTAGLAHELNNPLASIVGYGQLLLEHLEMHGDELGGSVREEFIVPILREAARAQHLVRNSLSLARTPGSSLTPVPLAPSVGVVQALREYAFRQAGLSIVVEEIPDCHVWAEPEMLQAVILNIVNNALDAMTPEGEGRLTITARRIGNELYLRFDDDGPGLENPERALEPFYSTKPVGKGTGLGLALVHRFMTLFGGGVQVGNRPDGGAHISLRFRTAPAPPVGGSGFDRHRTAEGMTLTAASYLGAPGSALHPADSVSEEETRSGARRPSTSVAPGGSEGSADPPPRVLVVEDEAVLRALHARILRGLGAVVLLAHDGAEARRLIEEQEADLVISDVKMPGECGLTLYRWIASERPHLLDRFLFVTGDISDPELVELAELQPELFLRKPFEVQDYKTRVSSLLP
jgi:signal transduction histidine kinase